MIYVATLPDSHRFYAYGPVTPQKLADLACEHYGIHGCFVVVTTKLAVCKGKLEEVERKPVCVNRVKPETTGDRMQRLYKTYGYRAVVKASEDIKQEYLDRLEAWLKAGGG